MRQWANEPALDLPQSASNSPTVGTDLQGLAVSGHTKATIAELNQLTQSGSTT